MDTARQRPADPAEATSRCRTSSPFSAWTSCRKRTRTTVARARKIERFLSQPFFVAEVFTGSQGQVLVDIKPTPSRASRAWCDGDYDHLPEAGVLHGGNHRGSHCQGQKSSRRKLRKRFGFEAWPRSILQLVSPSQDLIFRRGRSSRCGRQPRATSKCSRNMLHRAERGL